MVKTRWHRLLTVAVIFALLTESPSAQLLSKLPSPTLWVTHIVWGTSIDTNEDAWSLDTVWGGHPVWANHVVRGTNFVGMSTDGRHIVWGTADRPSTTVWGNVADSNELSGSASTGLNDGR
jgi:hypothetical protein